MNNPLGHQVVLTSVTLGVINIIALALRILARWRSKAAFAADDALVIASIVPISGMVVIGYLSSSNTRHLPVHIADLSRC